MENPNGISYEKEGIIFVRYFEGGRIEDRDKLFQDNDVLTIHFAGMGNELSTVHVPGMTGFYKDDVTGKWIATRKILKNKSFCGYISQFIRQL